MTPLQISSIVRSNYIKLVGPAAVSGYTKYIVSDGHNHMVVEKDYKPKPGECLFECEMRRQSACVTLLKSNISLPPSN